MIALPEVRRESSRGFHFINTYQSCPRKWYLRYPCGVLPKKVGKALIFGKAWHNALEIAYRGGSFEEAHTKLLAELHTSREEYARSDDAESDLRRADVLLRAWWDTLGTRLHTDYQILHVEEQMEPKVMDRFSMTIRLDAVIRRKEDGLIFIAEHKSTASSIQNMIDSVDRQDQATAYSWGLLSCKPEYRMNFGGVLLDVAFLSMRNGMPASTGASVQTAVIYRNDAQLGAFELAMYGLFMEVGQKIRAVQELSQNPIARDVLAAQLFPRNGYACSLFGCDYEDVCRGRTTPQQDLPVQYTYEPWEDWQSLPEAEGG